MTIPFHGMSPDLEKMPGFKNALDTANQNLSPGQNRDSSDANNASEDTSTPSQETQEQETNEKTGRNAKGEND